jgi:molybdopterin synthase sulfur carrier subunit
MKVKVLFFGVLAEKAGDEFTEIEGVKDIDSLKRVLLDKYPDFENYSYQISINRNISRENNKLSDGDELALLPPFAGG